MYQETATASSAGIYIQLPLSNTAVVWQAGGRGSNPNRIREIIFKELCIFAKLRMNRKYLVSKIGQMK